MEHHEAAFCLSPVVAHHIGVRQRPGYRLLPLAQKLDGPDAVPNLGGFLKPQLLRRQLHLGSKLVHHLVQPALQQPHRLVNGTAVLTLIHLLTDIPGELLVTGRQAQRLPQGVDDTIAGLTAPIRAEIPGPILLHLGGQGKLGIVPQ